MQSLVRSCYFVFYISFRSKHITMLVFPVLAPVQPPSILESEWLVLLCKQEPLHGSKDSSSNQASVAVGFAFVDAAAGRFYVGSIQDDCTHSGLRELLTKVHSIIYAFMIQIMFLMFLSLQQSCCVKKKVLVWRWLCLFTLHLKIKSPEFCAIGFCCCRLPLRKSCMNLEVIPTLLSLEPRKAFLSLALDLLVCHNNFLHYTQSADVWNDGTVHVMTRVCVVDSSFI